MRIKAPAGNIINKREGRTGLTRYLLKLVAWALWLSVGAALAMGPGPFWMGFYMVVSGAVASAFAKR